MLQIRNVQMLPDGRSVVETWGTWRFRIMERGMRDGYTVARVERIEDYEEELESTPSSAGDSQELSPGRAGPSRAEDAVRAEIGDVFVDAPPDPASASVSAGEPRAGTPAPSSVGRSGAADPAIAPPPSTSGRREDRSAGRPSEKLADGIGAPPRRAPSNAELMAKCHAFIEQTRQGTPWVVQHLHNNFVPMPSDPVAFGFWMALVSPPARDVHIMLTTRSSPAAAYRRAREGQASPHSLSASPSASRRALDRAAEQPVVSTLSHRRPLVPILSPSLLSLCSWGD